MSKETNILGKNIIANLAATLFLNPLSAIAAYIQNSVDANATEVDLSIQSNKIIMRDNGIGMDFTTLSRSVNVGVSNKNPSQNAGFLGIGHLERIPDR